MPYEVFQGGRRRKRRRWPRLVAVLVLLGVGLGAGLTLAPKHEPKLPAPATPTVEAPLRITTPPAPAPLAGGGTAPSPLSVRLDDPRDLVRLRFKHPPRSGLMFDLDTGQVLWRRDPTRVLPIASLTKMMTAILIARHVPPNAKVRITKAALSYKGSGVGLFRRGRRIPVRTMLYGLLLPSGNDAAIALAQRAGRGSVKRFVGDDEPRGAGDGPRVHALQLARRLRRPRQPLVRARPRGARARGAARAADRAHRAPPPGRAPVPDQGREDLPLQPQSAAAAGLPRRHGRQDRLHGRGRPLPRGDRATRPRAARRGAAALTGSRARRRASCSTAASGWIGSGYHHQRWPPLPPALPSSGAGASWRSACCC